MSGGDPASHYFDSSAVVKLYVLESGSDRVRSIARESAGSGIAIADVTRVELSSAVWRSVKSGRLAEALGTEVMRRFRDDCSNGVLKILPVSNRTISSAEHLCRKHGLRAYDAIQLASALELAALRGSFLLEGPILVCADQDLLTAAVAERLSSIDPTVE